MSYCCVVHVIVVGGSIVCDNIQNKLANSLHSQLWTARAVKFMQCWCFLLESGAVRE